VIDFASIPFDELFVDPHMFDSRGSWKRAGFVVLDPAKETECMVAAHPRAPGYLFKKYAADVSQREQNANFRARLEGATRLACLVAEQRLQHVVVPRKHLHDLPGQFKSDGHTSRILVVERVDVVGRRETERRFHEIAEPVLRALTAFPGLDSNSKNVQFTRDGKIAFVDLENWEKKGRDRVRLKSIREYLSRDGRRRAKKILAELR
jgi:hypothetical protein